MEILFELLMPLLEFLAEILLQVAFEWLAQAGLRAVRAPFRRSVPSSGSGSVSSAIAPEWAAIGYALFGAAAGGLSLWVFPHGFITAWPARVANLVVTPVLAGASMALIGTLRRRRGQELMRLDRFAYGMVFAFAMALVRFFFAHPAV